MSIGISLGVWAQVDGPMTAYSMVTRDGRRLVSYKGADGSEVFKLVPLSELPEGLPEVRPWKIFSIKSSHTDIGLHNSQYIQRHGSVKHIRDAAALVDADQRADTDPAAYRYIMEGFWVWHNYPMDMGQTAAANLVSEYFRRGRLDVGATVQTLTWQPGIGRPWRTDNTAWR